MRIAIEIPKEFEGHFEHDKFEDSLHRLSADAHCIAGHYEQETAIMLINAFKDSQPVQDINIVIDRILEKLDEDTTCPNYSKSCADALMCGYDEMRKQAKEIVRIALEECNYTTDKSTGVIKKSLCFSDEKCELCVHHSVAASEFPCSRCVDHNCFEASERYDEIFKKGYDKAIEDMKRALEIATADESSKNGNKDVI